MLAKRPAKNAPCGSRSERFSIQTMRQRASINALRLCTANAGCGLLFTADKFAQFKPNRVQGKRELRISVSDIFAKRLSNTYIRGRPWLQETGSLLLAIITDPKDRITVESVVGRELLAGCTVAFYPGLCLDNGSRARCNSAFGVNKTPRFDVVSFLTNPNSHTSRQFVRLCSVFTVTHASPRMKKLMGIDSKHFAIVQLLEDVWKSKKAPLSLKRRVTRGLQQCADNTDTTDGKHRFGSRYVWAPPEATYSILDIRTFYDLEHAIPDFNTCSPGGPPMCFYIQDRFRFYYTRGGAGTLDG